ncbi:MAG: hypothetical protein QXT26_07065 [Thermoproteota archaeon]
MGFVTAKDWRKMKTKDILTSLEIAVEELKTREDYGGEEPRILRLARELIDIALWLSCPDCGRRFERVALSREYMIIGCPLHRDYDSIMYFNTDETEGS